VAFLTGSPRRCVLWCGSPRFGKWTCLAFGIKGTEDRQEVSADEIRYLLTDSDELSEQEKSMIHDVIELVMPLRAK
jgi:hypothetical protein